MHIAKKLESNCINCNSIQFWINMQLPEVKMHRFASKTKLCLKHCWTDWGRGTCWPTSFITHKDQHAVVGKAVVVLRSPPAVTLWDLNRSALLNMLDRPITQCVWAVSWGARGALHSGLAAKGILLDSVHQSDSEFLCFFFLPTKLLIIFWL